MPLLMFLRMFKVDYISYLDKIQGGFALTNMYCLNRPIAKIDWWMGNSRHFLCKCYFCLFWSVRSEGQEYIF